MGEEGIVDDDVVSWYWTNTVDDTAVDAYDGIKVDDGVVIMLNIHIRSD